MIYPPPMYLYSIAAYTDAILDVLDERSMECLKSMPIEKLPSLHHTWGMAIRNDFGLWNADHPLTTNWHNNPDSHIISGGVDNSPDHPDWVSMEIMRAVWRKVNA